MTDFATTDVTAPRRCTLSLPARGGEMALIEMGDPDRPVDLVFVHANGFNARTYRTVMAPLAQRFRILMPDLRGHGRTRLPVQTAGRRGWDDLGDDLAALLDTIEGPPVVLAGHSMGGTSSLLATGKRPDRVSRLVLFDPVIWSRGAAFAFRFPILRDLPSRIPMVKAATRRRRTFDDREQALTAYRGRGAFKGWPDAMIADYLEDGLVETAEGGLVLACTPEWEVSNYIAQGHDPWRVLDRLDRPLRVLKAETGSPCRVGPDARRRRSVETVAGGNHFFPMVMPDVARAALTAACDAS
ncbi:MAG: alpha/beta fold hydrolase [Brevundimonas sp.]|uniref:alpha/beta fold hydrolase n=1 Tax=Brevundimonas sp. TaxID=1871086 RepID=UPI0040333082